MALKSDAKFDLLLGKWHEKFDKFSPQHSKVSKLELWWHPFAQSRKCLKLKTYREVMCHDNEEWYKNWRGIDLSFQNWHEDLTNFDSSTQKSKKIAL